MKLTFKIEFKRYWSETHWQEPWDDCCWTEYWPESYWSDVAYYGRSEPWGVSHSFSFTGNPI